MGTCVKFGQTDDVEKKFMKFDEVVKLVQAAVKEPEHTGNYHDYVELCKLYDKNENGTMKMVSSPTLLSWTNCAASKSTMPRPKTICYQNQKTNNSKLTKTIKIQTAQNLCKQHPHYG